MADKLDDLEALKIVCNALEKFEQSDRERIIRWASERLGIKGQVSQFDTQQQQSFSNPPAFTGQHSGTKDIRTFLQEKNPTSANQLIAAVAYYYKFEAPATERKNSITADDVVDACRKAGRERPKFPNEIMANAKNYGLIDKTGQGLYEINAVGENLVAVSMPTSGHGNSGSKRNTTKKAAPKKKSAKKKAS
jgi:hypothetical protein